MGTTLKGASGIKGFALKHGEKVAIAFIGLIAAWFVYKSLDLPRLDEKYQADKLESAWRQTSSEVQSYTWDKAVADHPDKVKKAQPIQAKGDLTVNTDFYVNKDAGGKPAFGIANSIVAPTILRTDPVILNVIDVRATGGSGLLSFLDEEIRNQQNLRRLKEEEDLAKKEAARAKKEEQRQQAEGGPGKRGRPEDIAAEPIDPDHPKRRQVQGSTVLAGVPLQGGERIERAYWACVVAKVPIREQLKLYQDAFEKARGGDATRDFPSYTGFFIERAEVLPGKELQWKPVPLYDAQRKGQPSIAANKPLTADPLHVVAKPAFDRLVEVATNFWSGGISQDVIDARFAEYPLTLPLPPLVGRQWGAEATHPDIPLAIDTPPLEPETEQLTELTPEQKAAEAKANSGFGSAASTAQGAMPGNAFGAGRPGGPGGEFAQPGGRPGMMPRSFGPEGGPGMRPGMSNRFMSRGDPGGPGGEGAFRGGGAGQLAGQHTTLPKSVDFYLLRFFDFSVEPGKRYRYRVKLVVNDPNYNLPQGVLAQEVQERQARDAQTARAQKGEKPWFRIIDKWSDPSPIVGIPMAGNVRLASVKVPPAEKFNDEPTATMLVEAFDVDETGGPIQSAVEKDLRRGYVANMVQDAEYLIDPTLIDTMPSFKFMTGMTLLDVDGGTKLVRDYTAPARALVMGPAGELYIRSELNDKTDVQNHRILFAKPDKRAGAGGPEGMPPGGSRGRGAGRQ